VYLGSKKSIVLCQTEEVTCLIRSRRSLENLVGAHWSSSTIVPVAIWHWNPYIWVGQILLQAKRSMTHNNSTTKIEQLTVRSESYFVSGVTFSGSLCHQGLHLRILREDFQSGNKVELEYSDKSLTLRSCCFPESLCNSGTLRPRADSQL